MNIVTKYLTKNPCYTAGKTISVQGLVLHSVGCPQPNPNVFVNGWNKESYTRACVHGFIGENDVYITLPCLEKTTTSRCGISHRGWHGGKGVNGSVNDTHIGFEMCEPSCIEYTKGANFICSNKQQAIKFVEKTTRNAVDLFALACKYHNLNPLADGVIISHSEGAERGIASNHGDPVHLWTQLGMNWTMDRFRQEVYNKMHENDIVEEEDDDMDINRFKELWFEMRKELQDNDSNSWSAIARDWSVSNGLINGGGTLPDGKPNYMWDDVVTREQLACLFYRFAQLMGKA